MSDVFTMVSPERFDGFVASARRIVMDSGVDINRSWPKGIVEAHDDLVRLVHRRGEFFFLPTMAFVEAIMARHQVDVSSAYHRAYRGMPEVM